MTLVAGATGMLGGEICRLLSERGERARGLVRPTSDRQRVKELEALGVEIVEGEVQDRESLALACDGVESVISTISSMPTRYQAGSNDIASVDRDGILRLVDTAREAGVHHFVFVSFTIDDAFPLRDAKRAVEAHLKASRMTYTILRPSFFMEVWLTSMVGFDYANASVRLLGSGDKPVSYISSKDVARYAVASLTNPAARNAVIPLGGAEALAPRDVVKLFEKQTGRKFTVETVGETTLAAQMEEATDPMQKSFAGLMHRLALGDAVDIRKVSKTFGIHPRAVREYAREVCSAVNVT